MRSVPFTQLVSYLLAAACAQVVVAQAPVVGVQQYRQAAMLGPGPVPTPAPYPAANANLIAPSPWAGAGGCSPAMCSTNVACGPTTMCSPPACPSCPPVCEVPCVKACQCIPCQVGKFWLGAEYLYWQFSGVKVPPLLTGNPLGTPPGEAGIIGVPSTQVLLGGGTMLDDAQSGVRYNLGFRVCGGLSVEGDYFHFAEQDASYSFDSSINQILGRPFFNLANAPPHIYDTQLIYFPPDIDGSFEFSASSTFQGGGARLQYDITNLCCKSCGGGCGPSSCCGPANACGPIGCGCGPMCCKSKCGVQSIRFSVGYRYLDLDEHMTMYENVSAFGDNFQIWDNFAASNTFNGLDFGVETNVGWSCICMNMFGRFAAGINNSVINVSGQTIDNLAGVVTTREGGVLAQSSNSGRDGRDLASIVLEFGFDLRAAITKKIRVNAGYSVLYWGNVVRAGEQIDMHVHPDLFPPSIAPVGVVGAKPTHKISDFFAHGLNAGLTFTF